VGEGFGRPYVEVGEVLGFVLAIPALVCGIIGVVKASAKPEVGGKGHAITAIVLSILGPLACGRSSRHQAQRLARRPGSPWRPATSAIDLH